MVIPKVHGNQEGEAEEAVIANPGELQERVRDTIHKAMDLKRMTIFTFVPFTRHTESTYCSFKDIKEAYIHAVSLKLGEFV